MTIPRRDGLRDTLGETAECPAALVGEYRP